MEVIWDEEDRQCDGIDLSIRSRFLRTAYVLIDQVLKWEMCLIEVWAVLVIYVIGGSVGFRRLFSEIFWEKISVLSDTAKYLSMFSIRFC